MDHVPNLDEKLSFFRSCSAAELPGLVFSVLPVHQLPGSYLESLSAEDSAVCLRACMICWAITEGTMVPREMQLRTVVADYHGQDTLISAGTGSGKTLPIALCIHLDNPSDHRINLTVSPLKRLQVTQESDFNKRFHIPTLVINDDTSTENAFWNVNRVF
ncbi:hypothetical protein D9613_012644 [Agrocybe pediades]|uniref:DEAD/DEAH-box helicase domain-containing protein n=1 Tax=Agrocybe pediades TaxID=84607 RepID=A0A8H4QXG3_9AGAR|nr:hypothetical protein D9613_012644 [Agrocybe pediades]